MAAVQFCRITTESTFNAYNSMGTVIEPFLTQDNDMTVRPIPEEYIIRDAGVGNRPVRKNVGWTGVSGNISTYLFPSQTATLIGLATTLSGSPCIDLGSCTIDHVIFDNNACGAIYRRYTGCKIGNLTLHGESTAQGQLISMSMDFIGSTPRTITVTDYPTPAFGTYPTDDPYLFLQSAGAFTIGSTRSNYQSFDVKFANSVMALRDESLYASMITWFGRDINLGINGLLKNNTDRANYEAGTKVAASLELNTGTHTITMQFGLQVAYNTVTDNLPLANFYMQSLDMSPLMDATQSPPTDFSFTTS